MARHRHPLTRQQGIAAITALLVVAIATILAAELAWELHVDIQRTESMLMRNQAIQFALGAELMAADGLRKDHESDAEDNQHCDYPGEGWDEEITLPFEGGTVRGKITDMQGRFNLNNLIVNEGKNQNAIDLFSRLLELLELDPALATKVVDWIDPDQLEEFGGAEDSTYTLQIPPYHAANTWFTTTTELMAVDGFIDPLAEEKDRDKFRLLERYVTALPSGQKINVNSAEDALLLAMSEESGSRDAAPLRANRPYCDLLAADGTEGSFMDDASGVIDENFANEYLDVGTSFFQLKVLVTLGTAQLSMYSLLYRDANGLVTTKLRYFDTK
jgi:general secretion pathway protein K